MNISVIPLTEEYFIQASALETMCFSLPWSEQSFRQISDSDNGEAFGAFDENNVFLGHISFGFVFDEAEIYNIAVKASARKQGVATALLNVVIDYCRNKSICKIVLEVRKSNNTAIALYEKNGFQKIGERKGFYSKPIEDAEIYCKNI